MAGRLQIMMPWLSFFVDALSSYYGSGGTSGQPKPTIVEIMNEPFVYASNLGTTRANLSEMHRVVATRIKQVHPDVRVGGYTAAYPEYEGGNFGHWNNNWKTYIDTAGAVSDFYSLHLYDNHQQAEAPSDVQYRSGSNVEAILDMIEHYSWLKLGEVKPFNISEYGALPVTGDQPYSRVTDWENLSAFNKIHMQLLERSNNVMKSMPFMILKAEWGRNSVSGNPYTSRILRQKFEAAGETGDEWVYTDLVKFYELWADVNGTRVDSHSSDPDLQVDSYVDGQTAYIIVNNLDHLSERTIDLNVRGATGNSLAWIDVKYLHADAAGESVMDAYRIDGSSVAADDVLQLNVEKSATVLLTCRYASNLAIGETSTETKYYASSYLQAITANTPLTFQINNVARRTENGEAVLRLGLGRDHGKSLKPKLLVNGYEVEVPDNWRGYDQSSRPRFFGVIEIPVPYAYLKWNNNISIEFPDSAGHVSSLALQVFEFSSAIPRHLPVSDAVDADEITLYPGTTTVGEKGILRPLVYVSPADAADPELSWTTSDASIASVSPTGLISGISPGIATISALNAAGIVADQIDVTVGNSASMLKLDDYGAYQNQTYTAGSSLPVRCIYDAGNGNQVAARGIRYMLRELTSSWQVVNDYVVDDLSAVGTQCGASFAEIQLPGNLPASSELPAGNFYFLFVALNTENESANQSVGVSGIQIERSLPSFAFDDISIYRNTDYIAGHTLDVTTFYDAGSGYTVTSKQGGIQYMLREVTSDWQVVRDYTAFDASALGEHSGISTTAIQLPGDMPASSELAPGNFYFLYALFETLHPDAGGANMTLGVSPINVVKSSASIAYDDASKYRNQSFTVGSVMDVSTTYDAGSGYSVNAEANGVQYMLRELTSNWQVVNDYIAVDTLSIGTQAGESSASIVLPPEMTPTAQLPSGHFYYLYTIFGTDNPNASNNRVAVGLSPVIIEAR